MHILDAVRKSLLNVLQGPALPKIDFLMFKGLYGTFNKGIVIGATFASHANMETMILKDLNILPRGVPNPWIRVMDEPHGGFL